MLNTYRYDLETITRVMFGLEMPSDYKVWIYVVQGVIVAPILEEALFRGIIQEYLS